jgi:branched-chain amino acid aminotransferase
MNISITRTAASRLPDTDLSAPGFGLIFSDHMMQAVYEDGVWSEPEIIPYAPLSMDPGNCMLHYGQGVFEGLKAFASEQNHINIFRPEMHYARFNRSCKRLCIPEVPEHFFGEPLRDLLKLERDWIPRQDGQAMYIRPFAFGDQSFLGVKPASTYRFLTILSPVGAYYAEGIKPVKLWASSEYVRAAVGGVGEAKTPANYAASLYPARQATDKGFTQVLWLDALEHKYIEEVGTMNIFFLIGNKLITSPLEGTILGGVTRLSVLALAREWGLDVEERKLSIDEVFQASREGTLKEVFGTGTAAVISPVGLIHYDGEEIQITDEIGPMASRFYKYITDVQYGRSEDDHNWLTNVD